MPGFDGTGPMSNGSYGRGLGPCGRGLALRRGFGRGFGWRNQQRAIAAQTVTLSKEEEKKILEAELKEIDLEKQELEKRLKDMQS